MISLMNTIRLHIPDTWKNYAHNLTNGVQLERLGYFKFLKNGQR